MVLGPQPEHVHPSPGYLKHLGAPGTYKKHRRGCRASLTTGAGLAAAPRSPLRVIVPPLHTPDGRPLHLGSPLRPQVIISKVQDSPALPPDRSSLGRLTL